MLPMLPSFQRLSLRRRCITTRNRPGNLRPHLQPLRCLFDINTPQQRAFLNIPTILVLPVVFASLVTVRWTWKCCILVIFQNKIIFMPALPPNARVETNRGIQEPVCRHRMEGGKDKIGGRNESQSLFGKCPSWLRSFAGADWNIYSIFSGLFPFSFMWLTAAHFW